MIRVNLLFNNTETPPEAPRRRVGRPPKSEMPIGAEARRDRKNLERRVWYAKNRAHALKYNSDFAKQHRPSRFAVRCRMYGLTVEDFARMLDAQGRCCAICRDRLLVDKRTHIDHCHSTGVVRGILCQDCNHTVGAARDRIDVLLSAVEYLRRTSRLESK